jgi:hypothetical protein
MIYVVLAALIIAITWFGVAGLWFFALASYVVAGIVWIVYELRRPPAYRSLAYTSLPGTAFVLVLWPLRVTTDFLERAKIRRSGERYVVVGDGDIRKFRRWDAAIRVAREEASSTGKRVMVSDSTTFSKQFGRVQNKSWFVEPNGSIELLPRNL